MAAGRVRANAERVPPVLLRDAGRLMNMAGYDKARARAVADEANRVPGLTATVHVEAGEERLVELGMRLFAAVGQAAGRARPNTHAPRLITITMRRDAPAGGGARGDRGAPRENGRAHLDRAPAQ